MQIFTINYPANLYSKQCYIAAICLMQNTNTMLATIFKVNSQKLTTKNNKTQKKLKNDFYDRLEK